MPFSSAYFSDFPNNSGEIRRKKSLFSASIRYNPRIFRSGVIPFLNFQPRGKEPRWQGSPASELAITFSCPVFHPGIYVLRTAVFGIFSSIMAYTPPLSPLELGSLQTELQNANTSDIDTVSTLEMCGIASPIRNF